ncbi:hypothetical protein PCG10_001978 [Penicillium crustosum]|uniref:F-box domain-containing protein n=1 Tax=Penicillium crustosum TaxID=36656 RepID=A0A9P5GAE5_PENCR|nr:uncharacterized protein N7487_006266 [Penicillium crustosum]KAF7516711.1 hypothetical protein PCG10_001978 [Penicillium crustosum]KAJ5411907.1 hypothetical protein N7487_006266 [Penicillium crustosum]
MDINHSSLDRAFILKLPDELLGMIISHMAPIIDDFKYLCEQYQPYQMAVALSLVCKRFYRITVPYLYAELVVNTGDNTWRRPTQISKYLHRTFRENPLLWKLCRHLTVTCDESSNDNLYAVTDFLNWLTAAKSLTFWGFGGNKAWELLRLGIEYISGCDILSLNASHYNLHLPFVIDALGDFKSGSLPNLQTLKLGGVSIYGDQICQEELREKAGTAPFTKLQLRSFLLTPKSLEALVRWPRRLEEFELKYSFGDDFATSGLYGSWSLATLQPILYTHRKTLRSIKLYGLHKSGFDGFDLREFENLEKLSLASHFSGHQLFKMNEICEPPDSLLAPRLRVFHWDLTLLDQQCGESLRDFGQAEEDWLRLLARKAIKHRCPLRRIEITFNPDVDQYISITDEVYPWDRMDAMGADLRPYGIEVSYNSPSVSRERYSMLRKYAAEDSPKLATEVE